MENWGLGKGLIYQNMQKHVDPIDPHHKYLSGYRLSNRFQILKK